MTTMKLDGTNSKGLDYHTTYWNLPGLEMPGFASILGYFGVGALLVAAIGVVGYIMA